MTRWSAIPRTRGRRSALAYGSRSTTAAEDNLNRLVHHERGRYSPEGIGPLRSKSFLVPRSINRKADKRVDVEILRGVNFKT